MRRLPAPHLPSQLVRYENSCPAPQSGQWVRARVWEISQADFREMLKIMAIYSPEMIQEAHKILAEYRYELKPVVHGYANRTLYVNVGDNSIQSKPVDKKMKDTFTGGKGFGLWLLWNGVNNDTKWDSPENELVIAGGPIGGITAYPGSGKCTAVTISPLTKSIIDSNSGGYFGPYHKPALKNVLNAVTVFWMASFLIRIYH